MILYKGPVTPKVVEKLISSLRYESEFVIVIQVRVPIVENVFTYSLGWLYLWNLSRLISQGAESMNILMH